MLKKSIAGVAALSLLAVVPAFAAASASSNITINGSVADTCTLTMGASSAATNSTFATNTISITNLADATTAQSVTASQTLNFAGMCNYAHSISLESANGGLTHDGSVTVVGGTFDDLVEYDVSSNWASAGAALDAEGGATVKDVQSVSGANAESAAELSFNIDNNGGTDPLLAGNYTDTVTIQLGAAL